MAEKRPIQDLMGVTMEKMREMVDVQTIIGDPIVVSDNKIKSFTCKAPPIIILAVTNS